MLLLLPAAKYLDVDLIAEAFYYVPYLITSQIIIFGDIVFVFLQVASTPASCSQSTSSYKYDCILRPICL